jgi:hypothetical protein
MLHISPEQKLFLLKGVGTNYAQRFYVLQSCSSLYRTGTAGTYLQTFVIVPISVPDPEPNPDPLDRSTGTYRI